MAQGLAAGLAEGFQAGTGLALRKNEQEFEQSIAKRQQQRADEDQQLRLSTADREKAQTALTVVQQQKQELARQIGTDPGYANNRAAYNQQMYALGDQEQELQRHLGGADLKQFATDAQRTADDLHYGRRDVTDLSPQEFSNVIAYKTQRPASDFVDTKDRLSPVGQALQRFHEGVDKMQQDGGAELLGAFNDLYGHELKGMIGQYGHDGSKIVGAEFAPPVAHPGDPTHAMLTAKITTQDAQGRTGTQYIPILDDHGKMLAHPEDASDASVKNFSMGALMNHVGALESTYQAINGHPDLRSKAIEGYLNGHDDDAQEQISMIRRLGSDPSQWTPKQRLVLDAKGTVVQRLPGSTEVNVLPRQGIAGSEDELRQQLIEQGVEPEEAATRASLAFHPRQYRGGLVGPDTQREPPKADKPQKQQVVYQEVIDPKTRQKVRVPGVIATGENGEQVFQPLKNADAKPAAAPAPRPATPAAPAKQDGKKDYSHLWGAQPGG